MPGLLCHLAIVRCVSYTILTLPRRFDSMAAGVQNAAAVVCFMSEAYESSANCALEAKFAQQSGVPLVPVMMQENYSAASQEFWQVTLNQS